MYESCSGSKLLALSPSHLDGASLKIKSSFSCFSLSRVSWLRVQKHLLGPAWPCSLYSSEGHIISILIEDFLFFVGPWEKYHIQSEIFMWRHGCWYIILCNPISLLLVAFVRRNFDAINLPSGRTSPQQTPSPTHTCTQAHWIVGSDLAANLWCFYPSIKSLKLDLHKTLFTLPHFSPNFFSSMWSCLPKKPSYLKPLNMKIFNWHIFWVTEWEVSRIQIWDKISYRDEKSEDL